MYDEEILTQAHQLVLKAYNKAKKEAKVSLERLVLHTGGAIDLEVPKCGIIAIADWNSIYGYKKGVVVPTDNTMPNLESKLIDLGVETVWIDCFKACNCCNRLIGISPDRWDWLPTFAAVPGVGDYVCVECILKNYIETYLQSREGVNDRAIAIDAIDPSNYGYRAIIDNCENGWYGGQDDNPVAIGTALKKLNIERYIFKVDSVGQFDTHFSVYVHNSERKKFNKKRFNDSLEFSEDPAEVMSKYLRNATQAINKCKETGVKICQPDPANPSCAIVKTISPLDFVQGKGVKNECG